YSDQFEIHVIELNKELTGDRLDDWIRLFRVESIEELKMLQSKNPGVVEAVKEVMTMNLGRRLRALYEEHMRIKRDRLYLRNIAIAEGRAAGLAEGELRRSRQAILELLEDLGEIPKDICSRIHNEEDTEILYRWHKAAAKVESFADFRERMN
ncbi:MAG: Rpn family recombination-promoting nuclease/putative transposase, partial [Acetatifactor sp.]|nr:Rpn family recombination-promoting nuclease/putative transposase [Acetatifactor sp.]